MRPGPTPKARSRPTNRYTARLSISQLAEAAPMKTHHLAALLLILASATLGACSWAGKTTGKAVNAVEQGADEFEQAYKQERIEKDSTQPAE
jgi:hypothetical protein